MRGIWKRWTPEQDAILREGYATWPKDRLRFAIKALAPCFACSWDAITSHARTLGLTRNAKSAAKAKKPGKPVVVKKVAAPMAPPPAADPEPEQKPFIIATQRNGMSLFNHQGEADFRIIGPGEDDTPHLKLVAAQEKARALLRQGKDVSFVAMQCRIQMREVFRLQGEVRRERRAA